MSIQAEISLDYEHWDRKPSPKLQYKDLVDKFGVPKTEVRVIGARLGSDIAVVTPKSLCKYIVQGRTWSPFVFKVCPNWKRPRRLEGLFRSCQVLALDFDDGQTPEQIKLQAAQLGVKFNVIHHSFSSTPQHQKLRAVAFLENAMTDFDTTRLYSSALAHSFTGADTQCVDVARLYFGSKPDSIVEINQEEYTPVSVLESLVVSTKASDLMVKSERNVFKSEDSEWGDAKLQRKILAGLSSPKRAYVKRKAMGILAEIESFDGSDNSRYVCVWRGASRLARMPEIVGSAVYQWVLDAVAKNPHFADWDRDPEEVVMSAIEWSSSHADDPV